MILARDISLMFLIYRYVDFISWSVPPALPIYLNVTNAWALIRLNSKNILGTDPDAVLNGAALKVMCFDKTGTLT